MAIIFCDLLQEEVFTVLDVNTTIRLRGGCRPWPVQIQQSPPQKPAAGIGFVGEEKNESNIQYSNIEPANAQYVTFWYLPLFSPWRIF